MELFINETKPKIIEFSKEDKDRIRQIYDNVRQGIPITNQTEAIELLDYIIMYARKQLATRNCVDIENSALSLLCGEGQRLTMREFEKMNLNVSWCNAGTCFHETKNNIRHGFGIVDIPMKVQGKESNKTYLIDITFRQFCLTKKCNSNIYNELDRNNRPAIPNPGYFLNLIEDGKELTTKLLRDGFVELTPEIAKLYGDSFVLATRDINYYGTNKTVPNLKQLNTNISGEEYINRMRESREVPEEEFLGIED